MSSANTNNLHFNKSAYIDLIYNKNSIGPNDVP